MQGPKFIFVTGGVLSSLGKGISAASIGGLLEAGGYRVTNSKLDPCWNSGPGHHRPLPARRGVVTDDRAETVSISATTSAAPPPGSPATVT